ncbi:MAG: ATP-grasp domain-containing protein [Clostridium sp.]|nr:ATP-grasp domain-containing protein [Clostridium sp.]
MRKILIFDGHDRRTLAAVRNIGEKKEGFHIVVGSSRKINSSRFSKYCNEFVLYPDPYGKPEEFIDFITQYIKGSDINAILPMGDHLAELTSRYYDDFAAITSILVPKHEVFKIARDKALTLKYAVESGVPVPEIYNPQDLEDIESKVKYPIIIKPRISSASRGLVVAHNREEALEYYNKISIDFKDPVIQEMILEGGGHYQANLLFDKNSEPKASCVKKKIRQFPVYGGPSTFFKTVEHTEIEELSIRFLKNIKWVGPAEVEYMVDPRDGKPKLMEINPRLSATIRLSCFVGIDFPYLIIKNALGEETARIKNTKYEHYCQWLIPADMMNFLYNKDRFKQEHGYILKKPKNVCHMTYARGDIKPYLANLLAYGISFFSSGRLKKFIKRS